MEIRLFYSYSHKDSHHYDDLAKHLSILRDEGKINEWSDRKILPGDEFTLAIEKEMNKSRIILLLLSPDFLASESCNKEIQQALKLREVKNTCVIPVILRDCAWKDTSLKDLSALPKDAKAITSWSNKDSAWKNVYEGIKKAVNSIQNTIQPEIKSNFKEKLLKSSISTESLDKQFVYPDITEGKKADPDLEKNEINSKKLINLATGNNPYFLLYGDEQIGKTALSRMLFVEYKQSGFYPLLIEGDKISKAGELQKIISQEYKNQYTNEHTCIQAPKEKKILIIDDIDQSKINKENFYKFISSIRNHFQGAVVFANQLMKILPEETQYKAFSYFKRYSILPFGHKKRDELIKKCISLNEKTGFNHQNIQHVSKLDQTTDHINNIIGRNIVPSYPMFILSIFESIELINPNQNLQETSYGHCYHAMITILLSKVAVKPEDIDAYFNFLTHLSYWMFDKSLKSISDRLKLNQFLDEYKQKFIPPKESGVFEILVKSNILKRKNNSYSFGYIYIYYYFVAKYIAENIESHECKKETIDKLISTVHLKDSANILVFIIHHTKDKKLIGDITNRTRDIFKGFKEATLSGDEKYFIRSLHQFVDIQVSSSDSNIEKARGKELESKDDQKNDIDSEDLDEENDNTTLIEIKKSARKMEIIGQIIRNQHGSLEKNQLKNLFKEAQGVGLRLLKNFMNVMLNNRKIIEHFIQIQLKQISEKKEKDLSDDQIKKLSKIIVDQISYGVIFGWLHKIVHSIGYHKIIGIADSVNTESGTVASKLINLYIHTWHKKNLNLEKIKYLHKELKSENNDQAICILKHIVVRYIYMHPVPYDKKQKISALLGFSIQKQRLTEKKLQ